MAAAALPRDLPDLDLAFQADDGLAHDLLAAAGDLADPLAGAEAWHNQLSLWLADLSGELAANLQAEAYSLGLSLVGDAEIAALNQDWRNKAGATDVLAFAAQDEGLDQAPALPLPGGQDSEPLELGDIVISVETAARQASDHGHTLQQELRFLACHGLLHLLGWDHPDDASLEAMLQRQERLLFPGVQR